MELNLLAVGEVGHEARLAVVVLGHDLTLDEPGLRVDDVLRDLLAVDADAEGGVVEDGRQNLQVVFGGAPTRPVVDIESGAVCRHAVDVQQHDLLAVVLDGARGQRDALRSEQAQEFLREVIDIVFLVKFHILSSFSSHCSKVLKNFAGGLSPSLRVGGGVVGCTSSLNTYAEFFCNYLSLEHIFCEIVYIVHYISIAHLLKFFLHTGRGGLSSKKEKGAGVFYK